MGGSKVVFISSLSKIPDKETVGRECVTTEMKMCVNTGQGSTKIFNSGFQTFNIQGEKRRTAIQGTIMGNKLG